MSSFRTVRINRHIVRPVPNPADADRRPILGAELLPELYSNVYLCAKKKSGKTSVIADLIRSCALPEHTYVLIFAATWNKDAVWKQIRKWMKRHGVEFEGHVSAQNELSGFLDGLKEREDEASSSDDDRPQKRRRRDVAEFGVRKDEDDEPNVRAPEYIFVFDDLSTEIRHLGALMELLKENRHFKSKVLVSSQGKNDLQPTQIRQMDVAILFGGHSEEKLRELYRDLDIGCVTFDEFVALYRAATVERYSFLFYDANEEVFRKNFNEAFVRA